MQRDRSGRFIGQRDQSSNASSQQQQQGGRPWASSEEYMASDAPYCEPRSRLSTAGAVVSLIGGATAGALAMYLLDPEKGEDRRASALDLANRALETTTDTIHHAYDATTHALGDAWEHASDKASELSSAAAESMPSIPSSRRMRTSGRRMINRASDYRDSLASRARSYLPHFGDEGGVSATTAGVSAFAALALGVGAMWLLDPRQGRGRRAWIMQKANRFLNETGQFMRATGRHLRNKGIGYAHETRSMASNALSGDSAIAERVRSLLGRLGIMGSVGVSCSGGCVSLTGRCATDDVDRILSTTRGVPGVTNIDNRMNVTDRYPSTTTEPSTNPSTGNVSA